MSNNRFSDLRCNKEYKRLSLPLTDKEYQKLEQEILNSKEAISIKTWSYVVLYEFEKFEICKKHNITMYPEKISCKNSKEALLWICNYQLSQDNLSFERLRYLIGKKSLLEKILGLHHAVRPKGNVTNTIISKEPKYCESASKTRERIGNEFNISIATVIKYEKYATGLDIIYDIDEELFLSIMRGDTRISQDVIISYANLTIAEIKLALKIKLSEKDINTSEISFNKSAIDVPATIGSIKNMPAYDPDAEIASLTLTVPSWISSVTRVMKSVDIHNVSNDARQKLTAELYKLGTTIFEMIDFAKGEE